MKVIKFHRNSTIMPKYFQYASLTCILNIKKEGTLHKAIHSVVRHFVDVSCILACLSALKNMYVHLLFLAAKANDLKVLTADKGSTCVNASASSKVCSRAGSNWVEYLGFPMEMIKTLCSLKESSRAWPMRLGDTLRGKFLSFACRS